MSTSARIDLFIVHLECDTHELEASSALKDSLPLALLLRA